MQGTLVDALSSFWRRKASPNEFWALKGVSLTIEEGDRLGIIGKNGAGKSTLLKLLSRITEPTYGQIKIRGKVSSLLEVGTGFHPELTGRENIFLNGAILGMSKKEIKGKFDEIVQFAEIETFLDTPVKRYSSGMYMRLGFAIAAHLDPDLLIVDEVLAVGDAPFQAKCLQKLNELGKTGRTVLFVSHDVGSVLSLCNKGLFLEKGEVIETGSIEKCVASYMKKGGSSLCWEGSIGDEHIQFSKMALMQAREYLWQGEMGKLTLDYEVFKTDPDLFFGIAIFNKRGQLVARSHVADDPTTMKTYCEKGRHSLQFPLQTSLFHEGEYGVRLECVIHNKKPILHDEVELKLAIYTKEKNTRYAHLGERGGVFLGNLWERNG